MDESVIYADIKLSEGSTTGSNLGAVQQPAHRLCPRWHHTVLCAGCAGNIVLAVAVISMGIWTATKPSPEKQIEVATFSTATAQGNDAREEGNGTLERFKSFLKQNLCEAPEASRGFASSERGSCCLCPIMWRLHKHKCYWLSETSQSWRQSYEACRAKSSQLLVLYDEEEKEFIQRQWKQKVWIGLNVTFPEAQWIWVNGSPLNHTWFPGMSPEESSCGVLSHNRVYSELCKTPLNYICQKEAVLI